MRFRIGDHVALKLSVGIFERGQIGTVCDCLDGEVLFESGDGLLQWMPEDKFELVPQDDLVGEDVPGVFRVLGVAAGMALLACVLIWAVTLIANYFGIGC